MKPLHTLILAVTINFLPIFSRAQNLIPNPGFELYDSLPCNYIQYSSEFALYIHDWFLPTGGTSDIISIQIPSTCYYGNPVSLSSCGPQYPRGGNAMVGMIAQSYQSWNEYVEVQMSNPLVSGHRYYFECFILLGDCSNFTSNNFGAVLSVSQVLDTGNTNYLNYAPVVLDSTLKTNATQWEKISGCFTADSSYQYLLLGHFQNNCDTSALYTGACPCSYYYIDDVFLAEDSTCDLSVKPCQLTDHISPAQESMQYFISGNSQLNLKMKSPKGTIVIYSSVGKKVFEKDFYDYSLSVDITDLAQGLYVTVIFNSELNSTTGLKFVKY